MSIGYVDYESTILPRQEDPNIQWKVTTAPTVEPITLNELKSFARIDSNLEDTILINIISSTRQMIEDYIGRALITQTITLQMDFWPSIVLELPRPPLISITSIATLDESDTATTYSSSYYFVQTNSVPGRVVIKNGSSPPSNSSRFYGGYRIIYTAGYGSTAAYVPSQIKEAMKFWATANYEARVPSLEPPPMAKKVLDFYKVFYI